MCMIFLPTCAKDFVLAVILAARMPYSKMDEACYILLPSSLLEWFSPLILWEVLKAPALWTQHHVMPQFFLMAWLISSGRTWSSLSTMLDGQGLLCAWKVRSWGQLVWIICTMMVWGTTTTMFSLMAALRGWFSFNTNVFFSRAHTNKTPEKLDINLARICFQCGPFNISL